MTRSCSPSEVSICLDKGTGSCHWEILDSILQSGGIVKHKGVKIKNYVLPDNAELYVWIIPTLVRQGSLFPSTCSPGV